MSLLNDLWSSRRNRNRRIVLLALCVPGVCVGGLTAQVNPKEKSRDTHQEDSQTDDLARRLLEGERVEHDPMRLIIRDMRRVESELKRELDAGEATQAAQKRIIEALNAAIAAAAKRGSGSRSQDGAESFDRRRDVPRQQDDGSTGTNSGGRPSDDASADGRPAPGTRDDGSMDAGMSRQWGNLPPRDRDEVMQGSREQSLEQFRAWIDRYYRALADEDRP